MASLSFQNVSVQRPIIDASARSIKKSLIKATVGGALQSDKVVEVVALKEVCFSAADGDRIGVIGHNGAGKTTLLQVATGIIVPNQGNVEIKGNLLPLLGHASGFDFDRNGIDNVIIRGRLLGIPKKLLRENLKAIAEFSGLEDFMQLPLRAFSDGMVTRLSVAMTILHSPNIIVLDEMFGAGDVQFRLKTKDRILNFLEKANILLFTSHDMEQIATLCNRVIVLSGGKLIYDGDVEKGIKLYQNNCET